MKNQLLGGLAASSYLRIAVIASACLTVCCVAACGGGTMGGAGTSSGPPQGNGYVSPGYAYIANANRGAPSSPGSIYQYTIASDGSFSPLGVPSVPTGVDPSSIVADPTGHFVYVVNQGDATISQFAVGAGGALSALSPATVSLLTGLNAVDAQRITVGADSYTLSVDPAGPHLYAVLDELQGIDQFLPVAIAQFSIGPDGTLAPLNPSYVFLATPVSGSLSIDPTGAYAYLGSAGSAGNPLKVFQFAVGPDGTLSPLAPASITTLASAPMGEAIGGIAIAPSGGTAYVLTFCVTSNCDGSIAPYTIGNGGTLSAAGAATLTGPNVVPGQLAIDGSGSSAYLIANTFGLNGDEDVGSVYPYTISSTGALSAMQASIPESGTTVAESMYGPNLYVLVGPGSICCGNYVAIYSIGSQDELTSVSNTQISTSQPTGMVLIATQ